MRFKNLKKYQKFFKKLVQLEREEEMQWHLDEIRKLSARRREGLGRAILHVGGKEHGRGLGGSYIVKYKRKGGLPKTGIKVGDLVILSTKKPTGNEMQATVIERTSQSVTVVFQNRPPKYVYNYPLRMDLFANDITFQRMLEALDKLNKNQVAQNILFGRQQLRRSGAPPGEFHNKNLNHYQRQAVAESLEYDDFYLIHGPPGTGKTTTLVESILQHAGKGKKVLATADSNVAVDNLVDKLAAYDVKVVRVGNPARVTPAVLEHTLDFIVESHPHYQAAQGLWQQMDEVREQQEGLTPAYGPNARGYSDSQIFSLARRGRSGRGIPSQKIRSMADWLRLQHQANELADKAREYTQKAIRKILVAADVVCTTNATAGSELMDVFDVSAGKPDFDVVFIDEASQSYEPSCLVPIVKSRKFVMAGDHQQLPPTVLNREAEGPLQYTLFERLLEIYGKDVKSLLRVQYRMHRDIMQFSNQNFYEGKLKAHESVAGHTLAGIAQNGLPSNADDWLLTALAPENPVVFLDTSATRGREEQAKDATSFSNPLEAGYILPLVLGLNKMGVQNSDIGIISPYDHQVELLKDRLQDMEGLEIKTVDGFQGREKEVIIISFVRSNPNGNIGFLKDFRRLNVAVTRARRKLVMTGDAQTLQQDGAYAELINMAVRIGVE